MIQTHTTRIFDKFYPISSIIIGLMFAQFLTKIELLPIFGLIVFCSTHIWSKRAWMNTPGEFPATKKPWVPYVIIINLGVLLYFSFVYSPYVIPVFLILSFLIVTEPVFIYFSLSTVYSFIYRYITVIILNLLSYYFQLHYLSLDIAVKITAVITAGVVISKLTSKGLTVRKKEVNK